MSKLGKYFSARLIALRRGKSQADFARELGIVQQSLSRYERGKMPDVETLVQISERLNVSVASLTGINWGGPEISGPPVLMDVPMAPSSSELADGGIDILRRRAKCAEQELADLRAVLRKLGEVPSSKPGVVSEEMIEAAIQTVDTGQKSNPGQ